MPVIQAYVMENTNAIINLSLVLTQVNEKSYEKGMIFVSAITTIFTLNFLYVVLYVLFMGKGL